MPRQLRQLFVMFVSFAPPSMMGRIWDKYYKDMLDKNWEKVYGEADAIKLALWDIEEQMKQIARSLADPEFCLKVSVPGFAEIETIMKNKAGAIRKLSEDEEKVMFENRYKSLNREQLKIVDYVIELTKEMELKNGPPKNNALCIDGPGGSGKTYTYNTLCNYFASKGIKFKTSAWMGIAASLLRDGMTMHKTFKLPLDIDSTGNTSVNPRTPHANELKETSVFIVDEISMVDKNALKAIDLMLRELMKEPNLPFGGKIFIIGGDFRQCLPVEKKGSKAQQIAKSVRRSYLWNSFKDHVFHLNENKRVLDDQLDYAEFILQMGNGTLPTDQEDYIEIDRKCVVKPKKPKLKAGAKKPTKGAKRDAAREALIEDVFGQYIETGNFYGMSKRLILSPHNETVLELNNKIIDILAKKGHVVTTKHGVDKIDEGDPHENLLQWPPEYVHSLNCAGLPPYELRLIKGMPVMVIRNLNPAIGVMNGTRLMVKDIKDHILVCQILNGDHKNEIVLIPKIKLDSKDNFIFKLSRKQFPVKPCFAMTINKSQGQTIDYVGVDMTKPVFSHGQCYVAFSRVRGWGDIKVAVEPDKGNKVKNIVWKELLFDDSEDQDVKIIPSLLASTSTPRTSRKK